MHTFTAVSALLLASMILPAAVSAQSEILVRTNNASHFVLTFARNAFGDTGPIRTLSGSGGSGKIAVDAVHNEMIVTSSNNIVRTFALDAIGGAAPVRVIQGAATGFAN